MPVFNNPIDPAMMREHFLFDDGSEMAGCPPFFRLVWKVDRYSGVGYSNKVVRAGDEAGSLNSRGFVQVMLNGIRYKRSRIVWAMVHDMDPGHLAVEHRNGNALDDWPSNLFITGRHKTKEPREPRGATGTEGVYFRGGRYHVYQTGHGVFKLLGSFDNIVEATVVAGRLKDDTGLRKGKSLAEPAGASREADGAQSGSG